MCYLSYLHKRSIPYLRPLPFSPEMGGRCAGVGRRTKQIKKLFHAIFRFCISLTHKKVLFETFPKMRNFQFQSRCRPNDQDRVKISILIQTPGSVFNKCSHGCYRHFWPATNNCCTAGQAWNRHHCTADKKLEQNIATWKTGQNLKIHYSSKPQPHFRSTGDHAANHTSSQHPVTRTVTKNVTRHHVIVL